MPRPRVPHKFTNDIEKKHCKTCDTWKELNEFAKQNKTWDRLDTQCKDCSNLKYKKRQQKLILQKREKARGKIFSWIMKNWESIKNYSASVSTDEERHIYLMNIECKKYSSSKRNEKRRIKYQTDIGYRFKEQFRTFLGHFANNKTKICSKYINFLGCSLNHFRLHIEVQFQDRMSWENHGEWHIDHIIPCNYFDLSIPKNQIVCSNYRNLTPCWGNDNIYKSDILIPRAKALLVELKTLGIGNEKSQLPIVVKEKSSEETRRERIAKTMIEFNQTEAGKFKKREAIKKRQETKARKKPN